jgi:hypothetical protein
LTRSKIVISYYCSCICVYVEPGLVSLRSLRALVRPYHSEFLHGEEAGRSDPCGLTRFQSGTIFAEQYAASRKLSRRPNNKTHSGVCRTSYTVTQNNCKRLRGLSRDIQEHLPSLFPFKAASVHTAYPFNNIEHVSVLDVYLFQYLAISDVPRSASCDQNFRSREETLLSKMTRSAPNSEEDRERRQECEEAEEEERVNRDEEDGSYEHDSAEASLLLLQARTEPVSEPAASASMTDSSPAHAESPPSRTTMTARTVPGGGRATSAAASLTRRLYLSHFLSTWSSRMFEFGAVLFLVSVFPETLLYTSVYALVRSLAVALLSSWLGSWIDKLDRLTTLRRSIGMYKYCLLMDY